MKKSIPTKLRSGDEVIVIAGKDIGKKGQIISIDLAKNKALVSGVNIIKRHQAPRSASDPGGIIEKEAFINCSNLKVICPTCDSPTRVGIRLLKDGKQARYCKIKKCNEVID